MGLRACYTGVLGYGPLCLEVDLLDRSGILAHRGGQMENKRSEKAVLASSFATRARTVDHLGREQIADCPTAISELWKNAWDAYARDVGLRIFAGDEPVAALIDDGHGMRPEDFFERWLVIGTESKLSDVKPVPPQDRNGLPIRPRQGQKGIGRLSSAKLGSVMLLVTKHRSAEFVAALIDWRLFENPYVNLADITVPTGRFDKLEEIFDELPAFCDTLAASVVDDGCDWRNSKPKLREQWQRFDEDLEPTGLPPSRRILLSLKRLPFEADHLSHWAAPGTAMLVYELDDTLRALPKSGDTDPVAEESRTRFERTLSNFVDPYDSETERPAFEYKADIVSTNDVAGRPKTIVGAEKAIDRTQIQELEHQLEGVVGEDGVFRGRVKAFGVWIEGKVDFALPKGIAMPERANTKVGAFELFIASMEFNKENSTHSSSEHDRYVELASEYAGLMIYRDGLRVLPYGREDNDFFEIEFKRSKNVGRYFWNHRQMFGRISLTRRDNPNLRDKAGREGFIDNVAAKTFRAIVENILEQSARRYFGSASDIRKPRLEEIRENNRAGRAKEEAKKLRERERKLFQAELEAAEAVLPGLKEEVEHAAETLVIREDADIAEAVEHLSDWRDRLAEVDLRPQPSGTARLNKRCQAARSSAKSISISIAEFDNVFRQRLEEFEAADPTGILERQSEAAVSAVRKQVQAFQSDIEAMQREQYEGVRELASMRLDEFRREVAAIGANLQTGNRDLANSVEALRLLRDRWTSENRKLFGTYVSALGAVKDEIDLETLASVQSEELREAAGELDRLTALAQLGIAVEIAAHDLADFDEVATSGIAALPKEIRETEAVRDIRLGIEGLTDQLRFLSPLRLSGDKIQRWIDGREIEDFVQRFFAPTLARSGIDFSATPEFREVELYERPARVFPVFLNLVNNAIYWVGTAPRSTRRILLDVAGDELLVSDSGPGVEEEDRERIFNLFFTRKKRSGRGVGLYLARANLAAGGHSLRYVSDDDDPPLEGATFYLGFNNMRRSEEIGDNG